METEGEDGGRPESLCEGEAEGCSVPWLGHQLCHPFPVLGIPLTAGTRAERKWLLAELVIAGTCI